MALSDPDFFKKIALMVAAVTVGFLLGTFVLTIPTPTITEIMNGDFGMTVKGTTRPGMAVLAFDGEGRYVTTVSSDAQGNFVFEGLEAATGTRGIVLRVMDGGWRSSPPKPVTLAAAAPGESATTSTQDATDLPPLGIPPTSTAATHASATGTDALSATSTSVQSISALASVANLNPALKSSETVTVAVKDQSGRPVDGATVNVIAHYPSGDVTYLLRGSNGRYSVRFKIPDGLTPGASIVLDAKAEFLGLTSTSRAVFTPR